MQIIIYQKENYNIQNYKITHYFFKPLFCYLLLLLWCHGLTVLIVFL